MFDRDLDTIIETRGLSVRAGRNEILHDVNLDIPRHRITAIIGPSGAGKSTLLRCLNRLVDLTPSLSVSGHVRLDGIDTRARGVDPDDLRRRVGMVFQQPVIFPGSIERNVLFAANKLGIATRRNAREIVERCLTSAGLWSEVKDRLASPAATLSVGQQQRLAVARTLAVDPEVILMDEPTSALDPRSMDVLEETIRALTADTTIVLVTHHLDQARRLADWIACICPVDGRGELMEAGFCESVFCCPERDETRAYLGGHAALRDARQRDQLVQGPTSISTAGSPVKQVC